MLHARAESATIVDLLAVERSCGDNRRMAESSTARFVVGVADHSGWAILVTIGGGSVLDRRRVQIVDDALPRQRYHAAIGLAPRAAERLVARVEAAARAGARVALDAVTRELAPRALGVVAVAEPRAPLRPVSETLTNHAWIHAAEGELYREAWADVARDLGLAVARYSAPGIRVQVAEHATWLAAAGKRLGAPWNLDCKIAALAAEHAAR